MLKLRMSLKTHFLEKKPANFTSLFLIIQKLSILFLKYAEIMQFESVENFPLQDSLLSLTFCVLLLLFFFVFLIFYDTMTRTPG